MNILTLQYIAEELDRIFDNSNIPFSKIEEENLLDNLEHSGMTEKDAIYLRQALHLLSHLPPRPPEGIRFVVLPKEYIDARRAMRKIHRLLYRKEKETNNIDRQIFFNAFRTLLTSLPLDFEIKRVCKETVLRTK